MVAVIIPAVKSPLASRATIALIVPEAVAVVALLLTFPAVLIVLSLLSAILPASIVLVTVPVSPFVITVPVILGSVMVLDPVGSATVRVV